MANTTSNKLHVAVIGGGPLGLCASKHLLGNYDRITFVCYEQRPGIGGTWLPTTNSEIVREDLDELEGEKNPKSVAAQRPFTAYKYLYTNLPAQLMSFPDFPYTQQHITEKQLTNEEIPWHFLAHYDVLNYLKSYAEHFQLMPHIRLNTQVEAVRLNVEEMTKKDRVAGLEPQHMSKKKYVVKTRNVTTNTLKTEAFDAVLVCIGHYSKPHWPAGDNVIRNFDNFKGVVLHAKYYRGPNQMQLKNCNKIVVIGSSVSGPDVALDISRQAPERKLILSGHNQKLEVDENKEQNIQFLKGCKIFNKSDIAEVIGPHAVKFKDGTVEEEIDAIICGTGFDYNFPFFEGEKDENPDTLVTVANTGQRIQPLYRDLVHIEHAPTLFFFGLHDFTLGFRISDLQCQYVTNLLVGAFKLPSREEMLKKEEAEYQYRMTELKWLQRYSHRLFVLAPKYQDEMVQEAHLKKPSDKYAMPLLFSLAEQVLKIPEGFRRLDFKQKLIQEASVKTEKN